MSKPFDDISDHITSAHSSHHDARKAHGALGASLSVLSDKVERCRAALAGGDHAKAKTIMGAAANELQTAQGHHDAIGDSHREVGRRLNSAKRALEKAAGNVDTTGDSVANPTGAMGAQASNGQQPRSRDPEIRRQQDQLTSCEIAYNVRQEQLRGLRR